MCDVHDPRINSVGQVNFRVTRYGGRGLCSGGIIVSASVFLYSYSPNEVDTPPVIYYCGIFLQ